MYIIIKLGFMKISPIGILLFVWAATVQAAPSAFELTAVHRTWARPARAWSGVQPVQFFRPLRTECRKALETLTRWRARGLLRP